MSDNEMPVRDKIRKPPFSFWSGFFQGFVAGSFAGEPLSPPPRYGDSGGIRGDWNNVGRDLRKAMRKFDERRSA